jgi:hypothetical protein
VHNRFVSAVKRVGFDSYRMSYTITKGGWGDIIVLNAHASTENKRHDMKDSFHKELEHAFNKFPKYHMTILIGGFNA